MLGGGCLLGEGCCEKRVEVEDWGLGVQPCGVVEGAMATNWGSRIAQEIVSSDFYRRCSNG